MRLASSLKSIFNFIYIAANHSSRLKLCCYLLFPFHVASVQSKRKVDTMLLTLTFHIHSAAAGQHHHVGWRAGWPWRFHCCSYRAAGRRGAGGGAGGARVGVAHHDYREEMKHIIQRPKCLKTARVRCKVNVSGFTLFVPCFSWQQEGGVLIGRGAGHSISCDCKGRLGNQPRHQRNKPPPFNGPLRGAVWTRHAEKEKERKSD